LVALKWGLIPSWAKDAKIAYSTINARADTVATKPAFRAAFKSAVVSCWLTAITSG
jgi:putative SOS response-associated peptidase YedK